MNFGELKAELRPLLWPEGEAENLVAAHNAFFNEALYDLTKFVPCYGFPHSDVYEHCATLFNCGMTVLQKPAGYITRLYTVDRLNEDTGLEDPDADEDHCAKVEYHQVSFEQLSRYVKLCERCNATPAAQDEILSAIFGVFRRKRRYPAPSGEGFETQPPLPPGFHYAQSATDASGRSAGGVWAIHRGRIYVAPWIQSTESVVIEWVGIKSKWGDADTIEDDIKFKQGVREHVAMQHEFAFGEQSRANDLRDQFYGNQNRGMPGTLPTLIHECKEQTRLRDANNERSSTGGGSAAIGLGKSGGQFFNDVEAQYTASCPTGQVGSVTEIIPVGTVLSPVSVADANAMAQAKAQQQAQAKLVCEDEVVTFYNVAVQASANCPAADGTTPAATGGPVIRTTPAGRYSSTESQEAADAAAYAAALRQAQVDLVADQVCTFHNAPASFTARCTAPFSGSFTANIAANQPEYDSNISQADADSKAQIAARNQANAGLTCYDTGTEVNAICNEEKRAVVSRLCSGGSGAQCGGQLLTVEGIVYACELTDNCTPVSVTGDCFVRQGILNNQAQLLAQARANALWCQACLTRLRGLGCFTAGGVVVVPGCTNIIPGVPG